MRHVSESEQEHLLEILDRHRDELSRLSGVHHVDVGYEFEDGQRTDRLAIRLHVHQKRPESELEASEVAPTEIEGVPVDVLQSNPELHVRRQRTDPITGGVGTTNSTRLAGFVGTLGAVVFDRDNGNRMALSNHHVYVGDAGAAGDSISQPTSVAAADQIGTLTRWDEALDCAVGTLNRSRAASTAIIDYPSGVRVLHEPLVGTAVTKSGRTTDTTFGIIDGVSREEFTIIPDPNRPAANGEISSGGDSGSIWLRTDAPEVGLGLHFAGETDPDPKNERAWAKRLILVARALRIRFRETPASPVASGDTMAPGSVLNPGQQIVSGSGAYRLSYQDDGNLVVYRNRDGKPLWASNTVGRAGLCIMQGDGNLVVYDPDVPLWSSDTWHHPGSHLVMQDDGNLVVYRPDGRPVWASNTVQPTWPTGPSASGDTMQPGQVLQPDQQIVSGNGAYRLIYQGDGNLVVYRNRDGKPLWASNTVGKLGICIMQGDGNLVLYDNDVRPVWSSDTWRHPGSHLVMQDDGNLVVYRPDGRPVWASNTNEAAPDDQDVQVMTPDGQDLLDTKSTATSNGTSAALDDVLRQIEELRRAVLRYGASSTSQAPPVDLASITDQVGATNGASLDDRQPVS